MECQLFYSYIDGGWQRKGRLYNRYGLILRNVFIMNGVYASTMDLNIPFMNHKSIIDDLMFSTRIIRSHGVFYGSMYSNLSDSHIKK